MPVTRQSVLRRVAEGQDPAVIGRAAHEPEDAAWWANGGGWWCSTPRNPGWHKASPLEVEKILRKHW